MVKTYDQKCWDLAELFLSEEGLDAKANVHELALEIQDVIESYIESALAKQREDAPSKPYVSNRDQR